MAKRSEIAVGQEWAANSKAHPLFVDYRQWTHKVRIESTEKVRSRNWSTPNQLPWYINSKGGREVLVRRVEQDGTLGKLYAMRMSSLRMLWADYEVELEAQLQNEAKMKEQSKKMQDYENNVVRPAEAKFKELLSRKFDILLTGPFPFDYEDVMKLIPVFEQQPDLIADEPETELAQSA